MWQQIYHIYLNWYSWQLSHRIAPLTWKEDSLFEYHLFEFSSFMSGIFHHFWINWLKHEHWLWYLYIVNSSPPGHDGRHFAYKFHWGLVLRFQLTITSIGLDNSLAPNRRQAISWTNADPIHGRLHGALVGDESKGEHPNILVLCCITTCKNSSKICWSHCLQWPQWLLSSTGGKQDVCWLLCSYDIKNDFASVGLEIYFMVKTQSIWVCIKKIDKSVTMATMSIRYVA